MENCRVGPCDHRSNRFCVLTATDVWIVDFGLRRSRIVKHVPNLEPELHKIFEALLPTFQTDALTEPVRSFVLSRFSAKLVPSRQRA